MIGETPVKTSEGLEVKPLIEKERGISKDLIFRLPENLETHPLTGLIAYRFRFDRLISPWFLFDPSLRGRYLYDIEIKKNKRGSAWLVHAGGDKALIVLRGIYTQIGEQPPQISGYYVSRVLTPEKSIIFQDSWKSYDNDLGYSLVILALPSDTPAETPIAEIEVIEPNDEIGKRILLASGKTIEPLTKEDLEE